MKELTRLIILMAMVPLLGCSSKALIIENDTPPKQDEHIKMDNRLEATQNWHHNILLNDPYAGIGTDKAYSDLLVGKEPKKKVVVAIIDSGSDIHHEDLQANIWINEDEIEGNGLDDDHNGYIDDIHGWNFIGGADGRNVDKDTYEATRIYAKLSVYFNGVDSSQISAGEKEDFALYTEVKNIYDKQRKSLESNLNKLGDLEYALQTAMEYLKVTSLDSLKVGDLEPKSGDDQNTLQAKNILAFFVSNDLKEADLQEEISYFEDRANYYYNVNFNSRKIVGDNYEDLTDRQYGNNDVVGSRNSHGTHVAGIIGAVRNNNIGINGVADHVQLMILRAVPDGDERDKDVANSIRYAADNGANIINMSFGKGYSPEKAYVDEAIRYAEAKGLLLIHSAGNESTNIDSSRSYPNKYFEDGDIAQSFITVGASSWIADTTLAASFSNYGQDVDLFAPGVSIYSTFPDNTYEAINGTSMAGPVVSGVAALIMAYYPELSALQVKNILLQSVSTFDGKLVYRPGTTSLIPFSSLSFSGGIVNAYEALKLAEIYTIGSN